MADPISRREEELLAENLREFLGPDASKLIADVPSDIEPIPEDVLRTIKEYTPSLQFEKPIPPMETSQSISQALRDYLKAVRDQFITVNPGGVSPEEIEREVSEEEVLARQHPLERAIPFDRPSVSDLRSILEKKPYLRDVGVADKRLSEIFNAVDQGEDDIAEEMIKEAPPNIFPEDVLFPTTLPGIFGRALNTRQIPILPGGQHKPFEYRIKERQQKTREYQEALDDGATWTESIRKAFTGSTNMSLEEAQEMGLMRGDQNKSFWRPVPIYKDSQNKVTTWGGGSPIMVAGGLRDLISRTAIASGAVEHIFAPLLLEGEDLKRFKEEVRGTRPTEALEHITLSIRLARDRGESEESIQAKLKTELGRNILSYSYIDLPKEAQFALPDLSMAVEYVKRNPDLASQKQYMPLRRFSIMVLDGEDDDQLQRVLNTVPFGQLPSEVYAGTVPSTNKVVDRILTGADYMIDSQNASGYQTMLSIEQGFGDLMMTTEKIDGQVRVVEGQVARWMSILSALTDTIAEARLPYDIPITPASRDFYYNLGIRSPDSTYFARLLANIETRDLGFTRHLTDEALMRGKDRGDPWYHMSAILGLGLDFLVPWEKGQFKIASAPVRFTYRGGKTLRQFPVKGYRMRAFMAGALPPRGYQLIYKSIRRVNRAQALVKGRFPETQAIDAATLRSVLERTGDEAIGYEESWIIDRILPPMERGKKPLSFEAAVDELKISMRTAPWENISDVVETYVRYKLDGSDGVSLYENLPPKLKATLRRVLDIVTDARDVERQLGEKLSESGKLHVALINIMMKNGDPDTAVLRMSDEYKKVASEVTELYVDGTITADEYPVIMGYLETQATRAALDEADAYAQFKRPSDYFANLKVEKLDPVENAGSSWRIDSFGQKVKKGKVKKGAVKKARATFPELSLNSVQAKRLSALFRSGDIEALFLSDDLDYGPLRTLMGDRWVNSLYRQFDNIVVDGPDGAKRTILTARGKEKLSAKIDTFFEKGSGATGPVSRFFADFQSRFGVYWMRIAAEAETIGIRLETRDKFHKIFNFPEILNDDVVAIMKGGRRNRPPKLVRVKAGIEGVIEGKVPAAGRQREFWEVEFNPTYVRQALGITDDMTEISAADLFSRAVGYTIGEHFKRKIGSTKLISITKRSHVTPERFKSIAKTIRAKIASVLGDTQDSIRNPKTGSYELNEIQQARMRVFLRQLANEPAGKILYERFLDVDADLSIISHDEFGRINEVMRDLEAGVFARKTHYSTAIPESLGKALWIAIRDSIDRAADSSEHIAKWRANVKKAFEVPDELKHVVGPAQREVVDVHLRKLEQAGMDVFRWAREAMKGDKDMTLDMVFDQLRTNLTAPVEVNKVDAIVGSRVEYPRLHEIIEKDIDPEKAVTKIPAKKGWIDLLTEFTDAEKSRHKIATTVEREAAGEMIAEPLPPEILLGKGDEVTPEYSMIEPPAKPPKGEKPKPAPKKLEFLLRPSSIIELQALVDRTGRGVEGLPGELTEAFNYLEIHRGKDPTKLAQNERMVLGKAIERIRDAMINRKEQIVQRGKKIAIGLAGEPHATVLRNLHDLDAARLYKLFYEGGESWKELLVWMSFEKGLETGLEKIGGIGGRKRLPRYRATEAFLSLIVRMRAYEIMSDMADDMVRYGMPSDLKKFSKPQALISPTGELVASPIETENLFWKRVKWYIEQELNFSMTRVEERLYKIEEGEEKLVAKRIREPQAPGRELYPETSLFSRGPSGGVVNNPKDYPAYNMAQEIIARYGHRYRPEEFIEYTFPSGQKGLVPQILVGEIEGAINRASQIGTARLGAVPGLRSDVIGSPVGIEPAITVGKTIESNVGRAIDFFMNHFPVTMTNMKMGVTTGIMVPNPAYFFGVGMGGFFQMYEGMGPVGTARSVFKNNKMTTSVVVRMWKDGDYKFGNPILIAKDGSVYTADQITELAQIYGLKSGFIYTEAPQTMARNLNRLRSRGVNRIYWSADEWQRTLIESATAMDNYYRVSVFVDALERGESAASAAKLARKIAFDYADLTDIEKVWFRNIFMFYSYMRKNMDLFWDTLLTNPDRILGQLRLMKGVQNAYIEEDTEVRLFERDYAKSRLAVGFKQAAVSTHMIDKWMYITPPMPVYDAWGLLTEMVMALQGDEHAKRYMITNINPWIQAPFVLASQRDFFYGKDINTFNEVQPFIMNLDRTILCGMFSEVFDIAPNPQIDLSRRYVEGREHDPHYLARNGSLWWIWKNMIQIPFAGRSMDTMAYLDRTNLGPMELLAYISRSIHEYGAKVGAWETNQQLSIYNEEAGPRAGLKWYDELLGLLGIKPFPVLTTQAAHQKILTYWKKAVGKEAFEGKRTGVQRIIKRRPIMPRNEPE
ncbi:hypothetical protein CMI37_32140 [Candidatus Pacearchaeota archaeon]|nr:hypothetical protein [Candidatus Pacearchaeota archaeon]|tara:strand:+ start:3984 stop:11084 length:7101 start_codon:yes stop_codon:yes gene_type:complete